MAANLELVIEADVRNAIAGIEALAKSVNVELKQGISVIGAFEDKIKQLEAAVKSASSPQDLAKLNKELKATQAALSQIKTNAFKDIKGQVPGATAVLTDFGRVAQDAPFGLIGIANNINPLVEGFIRLKKETGSVGGAFKSLGSSLMGGGGLITIVSLVTSAMSFAAVGFDRWRKSSKEAKDSTKEFATSLNEARAGAIQTGVQLQSFVQIARDSTKSMGERNFALKEANKLMGDHGEKLTLVNINTQAVTEEVNKFTQALINQALAAKYSNRIADLIISQSEATKAYTKSLNEYTIAAKDADKANKVTVSGGSGGVGGLGNVSAISKASRAFGDLTDASNNYKDVTKELQEVYGEFTALQTKAVAGFGAIGTKSKETAKTIKEDVEKIQSLVKGGFLGALDASGSLGKNRIIVSAAVKFQQEEIRKNYEDLVKFVNTLPSPTVKLKMDANIQQAVDEIEKAKKAMELKLKTFGEGFNSILSNIASDAVAGFAEAIGGAIAGAENPFAPLLTMLGEGLVSLGKYVIQASIQMAVLKKVLDKLAAQPALGIIVGAAMVALGSVIKSKANQAKFAEGGIVSGPMSAQIGEAGQSEVILPLSRLSSILGNSRGAVVMETRVSGQDLLLVQARASASRGRTF
jgi:hypothetical protein